MPNYSQAQIQQMITQAAQNAGVPASLALAVAQQESAFNPNAVSAINSNGTQDYGLFQINTANGGSSSMSIQENIDTGISLLSQYLQDYGGDISTVLWAYNAGPGNVSNGVLPTSTVDYIDSVTAAIPTFGGIDTDSTSSVDLSDLTDGSISLFGYDVPAGWVIGGGLVLLGVLIYALRD